MNAETLIDLSAWILPLVIAITLHEAAHGWVAARFGDLTATKLGRVSFNPLRHVDPFGTLLLPGLLILAQSPFLFGYAKPVPVRFENLTPPRLGMFAVALAGVALNLGLAVASALALHLEQWVTPEQAPWLYLNLYRSLLINVVLVLFNLIPILPFDGGRAVSAILPAMWQRAYRRTERFGMIAVFAVLIVPALLDHYAGTRFNIVERILGAPVLALVEQILRLTGNTSV